MVWGSTVGYNTVQCGRVWYGTVWYSMVWHQAVWCHCMVQYSLVSLLPDRKEMAAVWVDRSGEGKLWPEGLCFHWVCSVLRWFCDLGLIWKFPTEILILGDWWMEPINPTPLPLHFQNEICVCATECVVVRWRLSPPPSCRSWVLSPDHQDWSQCPYHCAILLTFCYS